MTEADIDIMLDEEAKSRMIIWDLQRFKKDYARLYGVILAVVKRAYRKGFADGKKEV